MENTAKCISASWREVVEWLLGMHMCTALQGQGALAALWCSSGLCCDASGVAELTAFNDSCIIMHSFAAAVRACLALRAYNRLDIE